jgi:hypothetical protein
VEGVENSSADLDGQSSWQRVFLQRPDGVDPNSIIPEQNVSQAGN